MNRHLQCEGKLVWYPIRVESRLNWLSILKNYSLCWNLMKLIKFLNGYCHFIPDDLNLRALGLTLLYANACGCWQLSMHCSSKYVCISDRYLIINKYHALIIV